MKTLTFFAASLLVLPAVFAADESTPAASQQTVTTTTEIAKPAPAAPDLLVMSAGSVLAIRGGESARLVAEMKLADGSIVTPGGTVRRTDGTSVSLADGQAISMNGNISAAPAGAVTDTSTVIVSDEAVKPQ
jgi:hypothetical protein